jgi:alkaline phosphatase
VTLVIVFALIARNGRGGSACGGVSSGVSSGNSSSDAGAKPKSIVFFISDGMGPGYVTAARDAQLCGGGGSGGGGSGGAGVSELEIEKHLVGLSRTRSVNSLVTDSAAGATAYSTGYKTDNHVVVGAREGEREGPQSTTEPHTLSNPSTLFTPSHVRRTPFTRERSTRLHDQFFVR